MSENIINEADTSTSDVFEPPTPEKLDEMRQGNVEKIRELANYGKGVSPAEAQSILFQTFLDTFLSDEDRLALDVNFEHRMGVLLTQAVSTAKRQRLMEGVAGAQNLSLGK